MRTDSLKYYGTLLLAALVFSVLLMLLYPSDNSILGAFTCILALALHMHLCINIGVSG